MTAYRLLLRTQATRGRLAFALVVGGLIALSGLALGTTSPSRSAAADLAVNAGLGFLVPVVALAFASAVLGDLVEDGTLVYVWLRPVQRWRLAGAAFGASFAVAAPLAAVPVVAAVVLARQPALVLAALVACTAGVAAYASLFVGLGLRTRRSLLWGLLYVLVWEGIVARLTSSLAAVSIRRYTASVLTGIGDTRPEAFAVSTGTALAVLVAVAAAGLALCTWLLRTQDVP